MPCSPICCHHTLNCFSYWQSRQTMVFTTQFQFVMINGCQFLLKFGFIHIVRKFLGSNSGSLSSRAQLSASPLYICWVKNTNCISDFVCTRNRFWVIIPNFRVDRAILWADCNFSTNSRIYYSIFLLSFANGPGNIKSTGIATFLSNIMILAVKPVLLFFADLNTLCKCGTYLSHRVGLRLTKQRSASIKVRLYLSTCPFMDGLHGVFMVLWICNCSHNC